MKKFWLLFSLIVYVKFSIAQSFDTTTFQGKADYILQNLDKSQIPTQILYDRVFPLARLDAFNKGTSDTSSYDHFIQAVSELYHSSYSITNVLPPDALEALITEQRLAGNIAIGIIHYQINWIDTLALDNNLLQVQNGFLYDVPERPYSPYKYSTITVAAALSDSMPAGDIVFTLPASLQLNNTLESMSNVVVDFGDGNSVTTITPGGAVTVNYSTPGDKVISYIVNFTDGTQQVTYSYITITPALNGGNAAARTTSGDPSEPCTTTTIEADMAFQGYDETTTSKGKGEVSIYYSDCNNQTLRKPIIILDGFDPGDSRRAQNIYKSYLSYIDNANKIRNLVTDFNAQGSDIIILNFPVYPIGSYTLPIYPYTNIPINRDGGADYIERNAFVLVKLIQDVNKQLQQNGSFEKLVIVGPSMGGLISRYALTYMEQHNMPHNTGLWISFDSPHNGANIPIGDQRFLEYYSTKIGGASAQKALDEQINSPAAKQMLIHHYLSNSETPSGAPGFRNTFEQVMNNTGFPGGNNNPASRIRRIALVNGSGNGNNQMALGLNRYMVPCEKMFTSEIKLSKGIRTFFFTAGFYWNLLYLFILASPVTLSTSKAYFTPDANNRCLNFEGTFPINAGRTWYASALNSGAGLDNAPGGYYTTQKELVELGTNKKFFALSQVKFYSVIPNHDFIPTKSALAFSGSNQNLGENIYNRNLVCTGETPFDTYFTPLNNESHVSLSAANVDWVSKEIKGFPQSATTNDNSTYSIIKISGNEPLCPGSSNIYKVDNIPSSFPVTWSVSPSGVLNVSGTTNEATVSMSNPGNGTLTATFINCGGQQAIVSRPITAGSPWPDMTISGPTTVSCGQIVNYRVADVQGASYQWSYPSDWIYDYGMGTNSIVLEIPPSYYPSS